MYTNVSNDNLAKLKELSDKICANEVSAIIKEDDSFVLVEEIKKTIDTEYKVINDEDNKEEKLNCYEKMFQKLQIMINNFKFKKNE